MQLRWCLTLSCLHCLLACGTGDRHAVMATPDSSRLSSLTTTYLHDAHPGHHGTVSAHVCCQRSKQSPLPSSTPYQYSPMPVCCGPRLRTHLSYLPALSVCTSAFLQAVIELPQASKLYMVLSSELVHSSMSAGGDPAAKAAVACCASTALQSSTQAVTSCPCRMRLLPHTCEPLLFCCRFWESCQNSPCCSKRLSGHPRIWGTP